MKTAEDGFPSVHEILGLKWDEVVLRWPVLVDHVSTMLTAPLPSARAGSPGPWRVVDVRMLDLSSRWQVVLAREYW
ncbi:MAG: hypothetical protein GX322_06285 [Firmicutes bacterium]|nr:hypothetical protein [Bacillota bacterium]